MPVFLSPLRDRRPDVALIAGHHIDEFNARQGRRRIETSSPAAVEALTAWSWPGNVRELL